MALKLRIYEYPLTTTLRIYIYIKNYCSLHPSLKSRQKSNKSKSIQNIKINLTFVFRQKSPLFIIILLHLSAHLGLYQGASTCKTALINIKSLYTSHQNKRKFIQNGPHVPEHVEPSCRQLGFLPRSVAFCWF